MCTLEGACGTPGPQPSPLSSFLSLLGLEVSGFVLLQSTMIQGLITGPVDDGLASPEL